ncbi:hypothetical protein GCM10027203_56040 [Nonomuraea fastidiosa]
MICPIRRHIEPRSAGGKGRPSRVAGRAGSAVRGGRAQAAIARADVKFREREKSRDAEPDKMPDIALRPAGCTIQVMRARPLADAERRAGAAAAIVVRGRPPEMSAALRWSPGVTADGHSPLTVSGVGVTLGTVMLSGSVCHKRQAPAFATCLGRQEID